MHRTRRPVQQGSDSFCVSRTIAGWGCKGEVKNHQEKVAAARCRLNSGEQSPGCADCADCAVAVGKELWPTQSNRGTTATSRSTLWVVA